MSFKVGDEVIGWGVVTKIMYQLSDGRIGDSKDLAAEVITKPKNVTNNGVYMHPRSWPTENDRLQNDTKL